MIGRPILIVVLLALAAWLQNSATEPTPIPAAPLTAALQSYLKHPCARNAAKVSSLIPTAGYSDVSGEEKPLELSEYIEGNMPRLTALLASKKAHAIQVSLLLQCFYYDHHVKNELALALGRLAACDPKLIVTQAERISLSPAILAATLSCEGICGPDENAAEMLTSRINSLRNYCASHSSVYCGPSISAIEAAQQEVKDAS